MQKIDDGISMIDTVSLGHRRHTAVYVVEGRETALVETGHSTTRDRVKRELRREGVEPDYIVPTHLHLDHAGATGYLAEEYDATVVCHPAARDYLVEPEKVDSLVESVRRAVGGLADRYGDAVPVEGEVRTLADGDTLNLGGSSLEAVHVHGHAPHQFALYEGETLSLFTADEAGMWMEERLYQTSPPPNFDLETNLESLDRLAEYDATSLVYTHFGARGEGEKDVREALKEYRGVLTDWVESVEKTYERLGDEKEVVEKIISEQEFPDEWDETAVHETVRMDTRGAMMYLSS